MSLGVCMCLPPASERPAVLAEVFATWRDVRSTAWRAQAPNGLPQNRALCTEPERGSRDEHSKSIGPRGRWYPIDNDGG
jgi:hypothetical protein